MAGLFNYVSSLITGGEEEPPKKEEETTTSDSGAAASAAATTDATAAAAEKDKHSDNEDDSEDEDAKIADGYELDKEQLIRLFVTFMNEINTEANKARLKKAVSEGRQPETETAKIQQEILEKMGLDGRRGVASLRYVQARYHQDQHMMQMFMRFVTVESMACDEAELTPEQFAEKKKEMQREMNKRQAMMLKQRLTMMGVDEAKQSTILQSLEKEQEGLGLDPSPEQQQQMMIRMQQQMQSLFNMDEAQQQRLKAAAEQRRQMMMAQNPGLTDQEIAQNAMRKLALAAEQMKANGISEEQVMQETIRRLQSGEFNTGLPLGGHGHSHGGQPCHGHGAAAAAAAHGHSHGGQPCHGHGAAAAAAAAHGHSHGGQPCHGHGNSAATAAATAVNISVPKKAAASANTAPDELVAPNRVERS